MLENSVLGLMLVSDSDPATTPLQAALLLALRPPLDFFECPACEPATMVIDLLSVDSSWHGENVIQFQQLIILIILLIQLKSYKFINNIHNEVSKTEEFFVFSQHTA